MKLRLFSFALLVALLSAFVVAPRPAAAKKSTGTNPFANVPATGTLANTSINIVDFVAGNAGVSAVFELVNAAGKVLGTFTAPVAVTGTCDILHLELGPLDLDLLGLQIHLDKVVLDITAQSGPGNLLGNLLCAIAGLLDNPTLLAGLLDQVLDLVGDLFDAVPVIGTVSGAKLNIIKFVVDNGVLSVVFSITNAAGQLLGTFTAPIKASGTCDILHLELGPLNLDLLGLQIDLSKIVLDITAQSGPGNLLGNLLCAVARLLDGGPLAGLTGLLNQVLGVFR